MAQTCSLQAKSHTSSSSENNESISNYVYNDDIEDFAINTYVHFTQRNDVYNSSLSDELLENSTYVIEEVKKPASYTLTRYNLSKKGLRQIDIIKYHKNITHLNLSANYLTDVNALGHLTFLRFLDVSQNLLTKLVDFITPVDLRYLNYSHNLIDCITDLSKLWSLEFFDISHNLISKISGIMELSFLQYLDISYNYINTFEGFDHMNLKYLYLDHNEINAFEENAESKLRSLTKCCFISISFNKISTVEPFASMRNLRKLNMSNNNITSLLELAYFIRTKKLYSLDLRNNPIHKSLLYNDTIFFYARKLMFLDGMEINFWKRGTAQFNLCTNESANARHYYSILNLLLNMMKPIINNSISPYYKKCIPIIILVGPSASGKRRLAKRLQSMDSRNNIVLGIACTTRPNSRSEIDGTDYYFIGKEAFNTYLKNGKLLTCTTNYGQHFAIREEELEKARHADAIIFTADINAGLQIKKRFSNAKLILAMPKSEEIHRRWLYNHFHTNPWISTYIFAYLITYQTIQQEPTKEASRKQKICSSILHEIIKYIEKIHEGKFQETEQQESANTSTSDKHTVSSESPENILSSNIDRPKYIMQFDNDNEYDFIDFPGSIEAECSERYIPNICNSSYIEESLLLVNSIQPDWCHNDPIIKKNKGACCEHMDNEHLKHKQKHHKSAYTAVDDFINISKHLIDNNSVNSCDDIDYRQESHACCLKLYIEEQIEKRHTFSEAFLNSPELCCNKVYTDEINRSAGILSKLISIGRQWSQRRNNEYRDHVNDLKSEEIMNSKRNSLLQHNF